MCRVRHMHGALWLHSLAALALALAQESLHSTQRVDETSGSNNNNSVQLTDVIVQTHLRRLRAQQFDFATFDYAAAFSNLTENKPPQINGKRKLTAANKQ